MLSIYLYQRLPAEVVFPICVAGPVLLMLLVSHFLLKERLRPLGWSACGLGWQASCS